MEVGTGDKDFLVVLKHTEDEASHKLYVICGVQSEQEAISHVRETVGYNPGCIVTVTETPIHKNQTHTYYGGLIYKLKDGNAR